MLVNRQGMKLAPNTDLHRGELATDTNLYIKYHYTDIITLDPSGNTILNTGGWHTTTTKERINSFTPFRVWKQDGDWFITGSDGIEYEFGDGVVVNARGIPDTTPVFVSVLSKILERDLKTTAEASAVIQGMSLAETETLWKKCRAHRDFIAQHCIKEFLPMALGYRAFRFEPEWQKVVADRLRGVAA